MAPKADWEKYKNPDQDQTLADAMKWTKDGKGGNGKGRLQLVTGLFLSLRPNSFPSTEATPNHPQRPTPATSYTNGWIVDNHAFKLAFRSAVRSVRFCNEELSQLNSPQQTWRDSIARIHA